MARIRERKTKKNGTKYQVEVRLEGQCRSATFGTKSEAKKWAKVFGQTKAPHKAGLN